MNLISIAKIPAWRARAITLAGLAAAGLAYAGDIRPAEAAQSPLAGRTATFIIGSPAGSGYDTFGRLVARHFEARLAATFEIRNVPDAKFAARTLYEAKPDGGIIGMFPPSTLLVQLLQDDTAFDLARMTWIGKLSAETRILIGTPSAPFRDFKGLAERKGFSSFSVTDMSGAGYYDLILLNAIFKLRVKPVQLDEGEGRLRGAFLGAVDGTAGSFSVLRGLLDHEGFKVLLQVSSKPAPEPLNAPQAADLVTSPAGKRVLAVINALAELSRWIAGPPGLPQDVTEALRSAFDAMVADPAFQQEVAAIGLDLTPAGGLQVEKSIREVLAEPEQIKADLKAAVACGRKRSEVENETC